MIYSFQKDLNTFYKNDKLLKENRSIILTSVKLISWFHWLVSFIKED